MKELQLKGFVTPADCGGDLQKALELAAQLDICKVVLEQDYTAQTPVQIPANMYIVIKNCTLTADLLADGGENYSFCKKWITVEGENGVLQGSLGLFNTAHVNMEGLTLRGELSLEYTTWARLENIHVESGAIKVGRGCCNLILQRIDSQVLYICGDHSCGRTVPGTKPDVTNIIVQDSKTDIQLSADPDCGLLNVQADHINGGVTVGCPEKPLPAEQFMNLTLTHLTGEVTLYNPIKHGYVK